MAVQNDSTFPAPAGAAELGYAADWSFVPVATELEPVREDFVRTWRQATLAEMGGREAPSVFRQTANALDVRWRLVETSSDVTPLEQGEERKVVDLAVLGAGLGLQAAIRDTIDRSEGLGVLRRVVTTATSPSLEIRPGSAHVFQVAGTVPSRAQTLAAIEDGSFDRTDPAVRVGSGFHFENEVGAEAANADLVFGTYVQVHHVGVDLLRLETSFAPTEQEGMPVGIGAPTEMGGWLAVLREDLSPRLAVHADVRGDGLEPVPNLIRAGVSRTLPAASNLLVRTNVARTITPDAEPEEWRVELQLQTRLRWRLPQDDARWALGQVDGARPSWTPDPDKGTPNEITRMGAPPAERYSDR